MTSRLLRVFPLYVSALIVVAALGGVAASAQGLSKPTVGAPAESVLPDAPSPVNGLTQPPARVSEPVQVETSSPSSQSVPEYGTPGMHVIVNENTLIRVMTDQALSSKKSKEGTAVSFTVSRDVIVNHVLVIPRGATVHGQVVETRKAGKINGGAELTLKLDSLELGGVSYPLYSYHFMVESESKTKPTSHEIGEAAEFGALAGAVVSARTSGGPTRAKNLEDISAGAAIAASATVLSPVLEPRPVLDIPAESEMDFYLAAPISVQPVTEKEAERLGKRVHPGGPVLYVRGEAP